MDQATSRAMLLAEGKRPEVIPEEVPSPLQLHKDDADIPVRTPPVREAPAMAKQASYSSVSSCPVSLTSPMPLTSRVAKEPTIPQGAYDRSPALSSSSSASHLLPGSMTARDVPYGYPV